LNLRASTAAAALPSSESFEEFICFPSQLIDGKNRRDDANKMDAILYLRHLSLHARALSHF
jgi:hypothetical protein